MKTYRDFEWIFQDFPSFDTSLFVTYVRDSTPDEVLDVLADTRLGTADGLPDGFARYPDVFGWIAAGQLDNWVIALSDANYAGLEEPAMTDLSVGRHILTHSSDVNAHSSFFVWEDGQRTTYFDPLLLCGFGLDPMPPGWAIRLDEVGISPENARGADDQFHVNESSFAMASNYLGVTITPGFLDSSPFLFGS